MIVQLCIKNKLGDFFGEKMNLNEEEYKKLVNGFKNFYTIESGFELWMEDGFMIMSPEMARKSILSINIIEYDKHGDSEEPI
jgi:hypothetical protein